MEHIQFISMRANALKLVKERHDRELQCHLQFVRTIGLRLATVYDADVQVVELACLLHDIGRDRELQGEHHDTTGARITQQFLQTNNAPADFVEKVVACIKGHRKPTGSGSIESLIVASADGGSKVEYHTAFMLLCKKAAPPDRARWGLRVSM